MRRHAARVVYSPSDLVRFLASPYASWMDRLRLERGDDAPAPDADDAASEMLARRGREHEEAVLARIGAGRRVVRGDRGDDPRAATRAAVLGGAADVVYQAALTDGTFAGLADFLVRGADGAWEVWDAKLSRSGKARHVLQLCCYADLLERGSGVRAETIVLALGSGEDARHRTADFRWYHLAVRDAFLELMARFDADPSAPPPDPEPNADHGRWASHAAAWFEERDHPIRVAGMRRSQVSRLAAAGVTTMAALARCDAAHVPGIGRDVLARLVRQARLQIASEGRDRPVHEVLRPAEGAPPSGLALLPPPSPGDVWFDFEGFPLAEDGLEYLIGAVTAEDGAAAPAFRDWWAHDAAGERRAFEGFVDFATERRRADPSMHLYHYGAYEISALRRLAGKYGTREDELDALLRAEAFVDLLAVVRHGVAVGTRGVSLKDVERLYRDARGGDVRDAAASMVEYDRWLESDEPPDWRASPILRGIRAYNEDDCTSTLQLTGWLRERAREAGIAPAPGRAAPRPEEPERALSVPAQARRDLVVAMLAEAGTMPHGERRRVHELLAHLVEFHRREGKPVWWALYDAAAKSHEELVEDGECLGDARLDGEPVRLRRSIAARYVFDPDQETKVDLGSVVRLSVDRDAAGEIAEFDRDGGRLLLRFTGNAWTRLGETAPPRTSLIPFEFVNADPIPDAIAQVARLWRAGQPIPQALEDFLLRRAPRVRGHDGGPLIRPGEDPVAGAVRVLSHLDRSSIVVQGPPGTGKTYVAARAIVALLREGRNVGVASNGHKAIENLLAECDRAWGGGLPFLKVGGEARSPLLAGCAAARHLDSGTGARGAYSGGLVGGTAWLFSRPEWVAALDVLFVDEAGQVAVANLVGVARSAANLVLVGDQRQLAQPTQGTHPGKSGLSLLDYALGDRATVPAELGIFLARTRRLHPSICRVVSDAVYDGRLEADPSTETRTVVAPRGGAGRVRSAAGIVFVPVPHDGNAQASDEEVAAIAEIVAELTGRTFTAAPPRALTLDDLLFVAPYNRQVRRLRPALGPGARVASVDKFQGQEAPVVVLSMCASAGEFGPRGSAFLLDLHRLNVALSRAQSLAVVVGDPRLARSPASTLDAMRRLNLLCRLVREGGAAAAGSPGPTRSG